MKINLAKSAGFCFGVKRALNIALERVNTEKRLQMLGDIVHNEDVVEQIKKFGIEKIAKLTQGVNKTLLIRAHGTAKSTFAKAGSLGYKVIDATCPMVKEIHKIAQEMERKSYHIIIIGDKNHDEVKGIIGQLKSKATVIENFEHIPFSLIKKIKKAALIVQSTQNTEKALKIYAAIRPQIKKLEFFNTICMPTRLKQQEIKKMPLENDVMIIIGSKNSANTKRLYEICKSINKYSYWIANKKQIKSEWFRNAKSAGITAGASTPDSTTKSVVKYIKQIAG